MTRAYDYKKEVEKFCEEFLEWFKEEVEEPEQNMPSLGSSDQEPQMDKEQDPTEPGQQKKENENQPGDDSQDMDGDEGEETPGDEEADDEEMNGGDFQEAPTPGEDEGEILFTSEEVNEIIKNCICNTAVNYDIINTMTTLLDNRKRRGKLVGGSIYQGYSGRVDPWEVGRADYRIFNRHSTEGNNSTIEKIKMNLFLDCSGSFWSNEGTVKSILRALDNLEKSYKNRFEFDVVTINTQVNLKDKDDRLNFYCGGGNKLPEKIGKIYKQIQDRSATNINIVLFDGDMVSDENWENRGQAKARVGQWWNNKNTIIITDWANQDAFQNYCPDCKRLIVCDNYVEEMLDNIKKTLAITLG